MTFMVDMIQDIFLIWHSCHTFLCIYIYTYFINWWISFHNGYMLVFHQCLRSFQIWCLCSHRVFHVFWPRSTWRSWIDGTLKPPKAGYPGFCFSLRNRASCYMIIHIYRNHWLVTGTWLLFFHISGMSWSQLTFIFFRGVGIPPTRLWLYTYVIYVILHTKIHMHTYAYVHPSPSPRTYIRSRRVGLVCIILWYIPIYYYILYIVFHRLYMQ